MAEFALKVFVTKSSVPLSQLQQPQILETRRFIVKLPVPATIPAVCGQVEEFIPSVQGKLYSIYWKGKLK